MSTTVVMTGGTSGIGAIAAERLVSAGAQLILGARGPSPLGNALPLDLTRLASVRAFAAAVRARLAGRGIDALVLNAGVIRPDANGRTIDGIETTFAVNYLSHHLLLRSLLPSLADGALVVLTTSGTHDPATGAGLATPRHADPDLLARPERDPFRAEHPRRAGEHAYTASKLCAVLLARRLAARGGSDGRRYRAIAYCPGQVFGTGLASQLSWPLRAAWRLLGTPIGAPVRLLAPNVDTGRAAGHALAELALGSLPMPAGRVYAALRRGRITWPEPSELARRDDLAQQLWQGSARLAGLDPEPCVRVTAGAWP